MPLTFQREGFYDDLVDEIKPLLKLHYTEIAYYKDIPLNPDYELYRNAHKNGILRIYTARDNNILAGYAIFFVRPAPNYNDSLQAVQDILFIEPSKRKGTLGIKFIRWCDDQLRASGVQVVYHHVKMLMDFGSILERQGYECLEKVYAKRLDKMEV